MSTPKISVNKLGEYIEAKPGRKKTIVMTQKEPSNFMVTRYSDARRAIKKYLRENQEPNIIYQSITDHKAKTTTGDFQKQDKQLSLELLSAVLDIEFPDFEGLTIESYSGNNPKLDISGVAVSVYPDLIIRGEKRGQKFVGAIKLDLFKVNKLGKEGPKYITTILRKFVEDHVAAEDEMVKPKFCFYASVFDGILENAPNSFKNRMQHISVACEEYALWWNAL